MRYEGIHITALGVELGQEVRTPWMVCCGALAVADACRTHQRSVCVAGAPGPELAVRAGWVALRRYELAIGLPVPIGVRPHASSYDKPDDWSAACFVLDQRSLAEWAMALDVNATSNSMALGVDMATGLLCGRPDLETALTTVCDRFDGPRFGGRHGRYRTDSDVFYGNVGTGVAVSRTPGVAELVSVVTRTDPYPEGLTRGTIASTASADGLMAMSTVDLRARQRAWLRRHGGSEEALRRNGARRDRGRQGNVGRCGHRAGSGATHHRAVLGTRIRGISAASAVGNFRRPDADASGTAYGHLGAADHIVGLHHLLVTDALSPGDYVVFGVRWCRDELDTIVLRMGDIESHVKWTGTRAIA
jgi:3-oxoacyl-[acyl-carrier-protein] synthase III